MSTRHPEYTEIQIPVPWGKIQAKWWGPKDQRPVLTLHGWQVSISAYLKK